MSRIVLCLSLSLLFPLAAAAQTQGMLFTLEPAEHGRVQLSLSLEHDREPGRESEYWSPQNLEGLGENPFAEGANVRFHILRQGGSLACAGKGRDGQAEGMCRFIRDAAYFDGLRDHGVTVTEDWQAWLMARFEVSLALLEELKRQNYEKPSVSELVGAGALRIDAATLKNLDAAGYRQRELKDVNRLVRRNRRGRG